jgi:hypothetical protein
MWKQLYEWAKWLFPVAQDVQQLSADLTDTQREVEELTATIRELIEGSRSFNK